MHSAKKADEVKKVEGPENEPRDVFDCLKSIDRSLKVLAASATAAAESATK